MTDEPSEAEIVRGLHSGDRWAWDALFDRFDQQLWRYVARLIGADAAAVADVVQETMLAVVKSRKTLNDQTRLWPWIATIAHNQAALHWRRHYRGPAIEQEVAMVADESGSPVNQITKKETADSIRVLLSEMNPDYASLLTAKYVDGMSIEQIVKTFGGSTESVRSRLARARRDFKVRYERVAAQW